jgi:hypothetical protein
LNLERLGTVSKKEARQFLRELPEIHPFVEAYVMLFAYDGGAVPLDDQMLSYLVDQGVIEQGTPLEEAQRFIEHHLKVGQCYDFYRVVRQAAQQPAGRKKARAKA